MAEQNLVVEVDCSTGIATTRPMTAEEIAAQEASAAQAQVEADAKAQVEVAKQAALASTNAKLMSLGLTQDDINNLLNAAKA